MDKTRFQEIERLYHAVAELPENEQLNALAELTDDEDLQRDVMKLLDAGQAGLTEHVDAAVNELAASENLFEVGATFGPYTIVELIGQGGMGEVYRAEQATPVQRQVAIKVLKEEIASPEIITRFESERQALALMDHDAIAKVYDAGTLGNGRPYFAMEYVNGQPLDEYCRSRQLGLRQRLEMLIRLCRGVAHAHQKGVLHRDLKPSNVLVDDGDDEQPRIKIIDFGIAKSSSSLGGDSIHTQVGQIMGTPDYMSPEQADSMGTDVDTRGDVYSLGVIAYELLTGKTPLDIRASGIVGAHAVIQRISDHEPLKPSARLNTLSGEDFANTHYGSQSKTTRALRNDLDWIIMRAIEKNRDQRYPGANDLADDIQRYLRGEPVEASPPSRIYRIQKFVKRHQAATAFSAIAVLSLIVGILGYAIALNRALEAEQEALEQADIADANARFLTDLFANADPETSNRGNVTVSELVDLGIERLETTLADAPVTQASVKTTFGRVLRSMGRWDEARAQLESALKIFADHPDGNEADHARAMNFLSTLERRMGNFDRALELGEASLALRIAHFGPDHIRTADSYSLVGIGHAMQGNYAEAEPYMRRVVEIYDKTSNIPQQAVSKYNYGIMLRFLGRLEEAAEWIETSIVQHESVNPDHPGLAGNYNDLGAIYLSLDQVEKGKSFVERALQLREKTLGPDHQLTALAANTLAGAELLLENWSRAKALATQALNIYGKLAIDDEPITYMLANLGHAEAGLGNFGAAYDAVDQAAERRQALQPEPHPNRMNAEITKAKILEMEGKTREAHALLNAVIDYRTPILGEEHVEIVKLNEDLSELASKLP